MMDDLRASEPEIEVLTPARVETEEGIVAGIKGLAAMVSVRNREDLDAAVLFLHTVDEQEKKIGELLDPHIKRAYEAHRALTAEKKRLLAPLAEAKEMAKRSMNAYIVLEEDRRRARELKAQEEAKREEEDRKLRLAEMAEKAGMKDLAEKIVSEPVQVPLAAVALPSVKSEMDGMTVVDVWKFEVTDFSLLVRAVADDRSNVPLGILDYKGAEIMKYVRALKERMNWPGVRVWKDRETRRIGGRR